MTEFAALREALFIWLMDAAASLMTDHDARYEGLDLPGWGCDADGIFRNVVRAPDGWDFRYLRGFQQLASWQNVEKAFQEDSRLSRQIDTLVGTIKGGSRVEALGLARHVIPRPGEFDRAGEIIEQRYAELEAYLAADELEFKTIWPLPGLIVENMPIELEPDIVLDAMSNSELVTALRTEIVHPPFPNGILSQAEPASRTCIRRRYRLPKLIGPRGDDASIRFQELEQRLQDIRATAEESLALVLPEPVMIAGRFDVSDEQSSSLSGGVAFQQSMTPQWARWRRIEVDSQSVSELREVWRHVSQRGLVARNKGLALALRRLSYQAQRERPDDELLDIMIAAEAIYLTELGNEPYRGELSYRLALRAAVWAEVPQLSLTKREVLKLMQSAYNARSAIAHGGNPAPKIMRIRGERVELPALVKAARTVVAEACRKALAAAATSDAGWPPDWDALILEDPRTSSAAETLAHGQDSGGPHLAQPT